MLDWFLDKPVRLFAGIVLLIAFLTLSIAYIGGAFPWYDPFTNSWHDKYTCHLEDQEIVNTITTYHTDSKGRTSTSTTYIHTGAYHKVQVCRYE